MIILGEKDVKKEIYSVYEMYALASSGVTLDYILLHPGDLTAFAMPFDEFVNTVYKDESFVLPLIYKLEKSEVSGSYGDKLLERYLKDIA